MEKGENILSNVTQKSLCVDERPNSARSHFSVTPENINVIIYFFSSDVN